jgi:probable phosphoglycerate mutase
VVIRDPEGKISLELAKRLGRETNNVAEYYGLLAALDYAAANGITSLRVRSDSELLVRQMQGRYKVKSPELKPLFERAQKVVRQLGYFAIEHVRREQNRDADALANVALDSGPVHQVGREVRPTAAATPAKPVGAGNPPRKILARFAEGAFVPDEPLDLPEGLQVIVEWQPAKRSE